jgi:hypothetical protein
MRKKTACTMSDGGEHDAAGIRGVVLTWLVRNGEPLRAADRDAVERIGMQIHVAGDRRLASGASTAHQREVFARWLDGVPDGGCELMFEQMAWEETSWTVYSSFDESVSQEHSINVSVFCRCGRIAGVTWRYEGTWGELIRGITED